VPDADIVLAIPSRGNCRVEWATAFKMLEPPVNYSWAIRTLTGEQVDAARCGSVLDARERGAKYLMFIDDDVLIPNQGVHRLVYLMDNHPDWDLLSGVYVTKTDPPQTLVFREGEPGPSWNWKFNTQFPITGCGMGCCLIRMSAFGKVEEPWFQTISRAEGQDRFAEGEDIHFCRRLGEAGGALMADGGLLCGHIDKKGHIYSIPADSLPIRKAEGLKDFTIIDATETLTVA
jgi:hypothetical protein